MNTHSSLLTRVELSGRIIGLVGRLSLKQSFQNPHQMPVELTHIFPLPANTAVVSCRIKTGRRNLHGRLMSRRQARQSFGNTSSKGQRKTLCTLEAERPDLYTLRLGPLEPAAQVCVELILEFALQIESDSAIFCFPLIAGRRYASGRPRHGPQSGQGTSIDTDFVPDASRLNPPTTRITEHGLFSFDLSIDSADLDVECVECTSHPVKRTRRKRTVRLQSLPEGKLDHDVIVRLKMNPGNRLLVNPSDLTFLYTAARRVHEGTRELSPVVILIDCSFSMRGSGLAMALELADCLIHNLDSARRFALVGFANTPQQFRSTLMPASPKNVAAASDFLHELTAQPICNLYGALVATEAMLAGDKKTDLVLLSSAETAEHDRIVAWCSRQQQLRIHAVGLGEVVNAGLLERLSRNSKGSYRRLERPDFLCRIRTALEQVLQGAVLSELHLPSATSSKCELFPGESACFRGRFLVPPCDSTQLVGTHPDGSTLSEPVVQSTEVSHSAISTSWARSYILDLEELWVRLPVGTVNLSVGRAKPLTRGPTSRLRQEAERKKAWLEWAQEFWRHKGWLFAHSENESAGLPVVLALKGSTSMAFGSVQIFSCKEQLENLALRLLELEEEIHAVSLEHNVLSRFTAFLVSGSRVRTEGPSHQVVVSVPT